MVKGPLAIVGTGAWIRHYGCSTTGRRGRPFCCEPVLEEIVRLQLRESSGALPGSVPEDPRHRDRGVVVEP